MGILLEFVPKRGELNDRDKEAYDTCAKVMRRRNELDHHGFKNIRNATASLMGGRYEDAPYPQRMAFAREVAGAIREAENVDACTFEAIHDRVNKNSLVEEFLQKEHLEVRTNELIVEMTLLEGLYDFLPHRMWGIYNKEDVGLGKHPRVLFQRLGLFEEENPNAPEGVYKPFGGKIPTADCLCDVLGVEIEWTISLGDHLKFDEPKSQLTLFALLLLQDQSGIAK